MKKFNPTLLLSCLILLIVSGTALALTGIYHLEDTPGSTASFETVHKVDTESFERSEAKTTLDGGTYANIMQNAQTEKPIASTAEKGMTIGEIMRWAGIVAIVVAIVILLLIEFIYRDRINPMNYRILLIISLFVLPMIVGLGTSATVLETTKSVQSCGSCHVMDPFVDDLFDAESTTLAARHYKNKWIPKYQCYTCHTTYGAHGTFEGKRDGFRHWLLFVTGTWDEPISYSGSYPNMNCTSCHAGTNAFQQVKSHRALSSKLRADEVSCTSCHGPAHPTPKERVASTDQQEIEQRSTSAMRKIGPEELNSLVEALDE